MLTQSAREHEWQCAYCQALVPANHAHKCLEYDAAYQQRETVCADPRCTVFSLNPHVQGKHPDCFFYKPPPADTGDRDYYREGSIECIDAIKAALGSKGFCDFLRGQVIKYNWRLFAKGGLEDSIKAAWYQTRLTKELDNAPVGNVQSAGEPQQQGIGYPGGSARG